MKVALDTNILAYAAGVDDEVRRAQADRVISAIGGANLILSSQVAGEFYNVLRRKDGQSRQDAAAIVNAWIEALGIVVHSPSTFTAALRLAADHDFQIWDALIVNVAADAGCSVLLSEDLQDGFVHRGVTIVNPFLATVHPLLASLLDPSAGAHK